MFEGFDLNNLVVMIVPLLFAVTIHEVAHGWMAYRLGDPTAKWSGRLTLNPIKHLDPFGSLVLPLMLFFSGPLFFSDTQSPSRSTSDILMPDAAA